MAEYVVDRIGPHVAIPRAGGREHLTAADDGRPDAARVARDAHQRTRQRRAAPRRHARTRNDVAGVGPQPADGRAVRAFRGRQHPPGPHPQRRTGSRCARGRVQRERDGGGRDRRRPEAGWRPSGQPRRAGSGDGQEHAGEGLPSHRVEPYYPAGDAAWRVRGTRDATARRGRPRCTRRTGRSRRRSSCRSAPRRRVKALDAGRARRRSARRSCSATPTTCTSGPART